MSPGRSRKTPPGGIRRRFEQGIHVNHTTFLGYDKDASGELIIDKKQAAIVRRIYTEFLNGKGAKRIAKDLEKDKVPKWDGRYKCYESSIQKMLSNEKYKGDALLQKTYTVDFLTNKRVDNTGQIPQYYVEDSHPDHYLQRDVGGGPAGDGAAKGLYGRAWPTEARACNCWESLCRAPSHLRLLRPEIRQEGVELHR